MYDLFILNWEKEKKRKEKSTELLQIGFMSRLVFFCVAQAP